MARIVEVSDAEIAESMGVYYQDTHNLPKAQVLLLSRRA